MNLRDRRHGLAVVLLLAGLLALTGGCGRVVNRTVERKIREALPGTLGPAREYRVHVASPMGRTLRGQLGSVNVGGDEVELPNGMVLEGLSLDLKDVDVDVKRKRLRSIKESRFRIIIRDTDVDHFLAGKSPKGETVRNAHVTFGAGGALVVTADRIVDGETIPMRAAGSLKIRDPQHAGVDLDRLSVVGAPVEGPELELVRSKVENAVDLSRLPIPVSLTRIDSGAGTLILEGTADLSVAPARLSIVPR